MIMNLLYQELKMIFSRTSGKTMETIILSALKTELDLLKSKPRLS